VPKWPLSCHTPEPLGFLIWRFKPSLDYLARSAHYSPGHLGVSSLFVGISLSIEMKGPLLTTRSGLRSGRTRTHVPSADFCHPIVAPLDAPS
jgi:hypothetical protein